MVGDMRFWRQARALPPPSSNPSGDDLFRLGLRYSTGQGGSPLDYIAAHTLFNLASLFVVLWKRRSTARNSARRWTHRRCRRGPTGGAGVAFARLKRRRPSRCNAVARTGYRPHPWMVTWPSGLRRRFAKPLYGVKPYPGFESLRHRQNPSPQIDPTRTQAPSAAIAAAFSLPPECGTGPSAAGHQCFGCGRRSFPAVRPDPGRRDSGTASPARARRS